MTTQTAYSYIQQNIDRLFQEIGANSIRYERKINRDEHFIEIKPESLFKDNAACEVILKFTQDFTDKFGDNVSLNFIKKNSWDQIRNPDIVLPLFEAEHISYFTTAAKSENYLRHFGVVEMTASIYGDKVEDIVNVEITIAEDQSEPVKNSHQKDDIDYWGWFDAKSQRFTHIYNHKVILALCFPGALENYERRGQGRAYRLDIKILDT